jgi:hypothetical protein
MNGTISQSARCGSKRQKTQATRKTQAIRKIQATRKIQAIRKIQATRKIQAIRKIQATRTSIYVLMSRIITDALLLIGVGPLGMKFYTGARSLAMI